MKTACTIAEQIKTKKSFFILADYNVTRESPQPNVGILCSVIAFITAIRSYPSIHSFLRLGLVTLLL